MADDLDEPGPGPQTGKPGPKPNNTNANWYIVGANIGVLAFYTLVLRSVDGAMFLDAILLLVHFLFCLVMSVVKKQGIWVLAAFLVLIIGISTCVYVLPPLNI